MWTQAWMQHQITRNPSLDESAIDIIPRIVWKTGPWGEKELPEQIQSELLKIRQQGYEVRYMDDNQSLEFLQQYFHPDVALAFRTIKPGAFKADLFRYCVLYRFGGVYCDVKQTLLVPLDTLIQNSNKFFVRDLNHDDRRNNVQISFMAVPPKTELMAAAIYKILTNVQDKNKGLSILDMTGPVMFGKLFERYHPGYRFLYSQKGDKQLVDMRSGKTIVKTRMSLVNDRIKSGAYYHMWNSDDLFNQDVPELTRRWSEATENHQVLTKFTVPPGRSL